MVASPDPLRVVEAGYEWIEDERAWLRGIADAAAPFGIGTGLAAYAVALGQQVAVESYASRGTGKAFEKSLRGLTSALGEIAHWEENIALDEVTRLYGQAGVRTSMTMWNVDPLVESRLFNLTGLSHKVTFEGDFFWAESDQELGQFPLYDPLQDDAQERFEQRFIPRTRLADPI